MNTPIDRPLTDDELAAIEERAAAASLAPWAALTTRQTSGWGDAIVSRGTVPGKILFSTRGRDRRVKAADTAFVCPARADVPRLLAKVKWLQEALALQVVATRELRADGQYVREELRQMERSKDREIARLQARVDQLERRAS